MLYGVKTHSTEAQGLSDGQVQVVDVECLQQAQNLDIWTPPITCPAAHDRPDKQLFAPATAAVLG